MWPSSGVPLALPATHLRVKQTLGLGLGYLSWVREGGREAGRPLSFVLLNYCEATLVSWPPPPPAGVGIVLTVPHPRGMAPALPQGFGGPMRGFKAVSTTLKYFLRLSATPDF